MFCEEGAKIKNYSHNQITIPSYVKKGAAATRGRRGGASWVAAALESCEVTRLGSLRREIVKSQPSSQNTNRQVKTKLFDSNKRTVCYNILGCEHSLDVHSAVET